MPYHDVVCVLYVYVGYSLYYDIVYVNFHKPESTRSGLVLSISESSNSVEVLLSVVSKSTSIMSGSV